MKRDDITKLFPTATDEQVSALLDLNSKDIGKAKGGADKLQTDLDAANAALGEARETIKGLEASKGDATKLQAEIERYKKAETDRTEAEKAAAAHAEVEKRFNDAVGERKFLHEFVRTGVLGEFEKALTDKANAGKGDKDLFEALTKDKDYFSSQNPPVNMGGLGNIKTGDPDEAAMRHALGLPDPTSTK